MKLSLIVGLPNFVSTKSMTYGGYYHQLVAVIQQRKLLF